MLNKLLTLNPKVSHRLFALVSLSVGLSWSILSAQIQLGTTLISIQQMNQLYLLVQVKELNFFTKALANLIDLVPLQSQVSTLFTLNEVLFMGLVFILSFKTYFMPWLHRVYKTVMVGQILLYIGMSLALYFTVTATNPNTALALLNGAGWASILMGLLFLGLLFITWLKLIFSLE